MPLAWDESAVMASVRGQVAAKLDQCGQAVEDRAKAILSRPGSADASSPAGTAPHLITGELHDSVRHLTDADALETSIGTDRPEGFYLEVGPQARPPHPWLRRALAESIPTIRRIFGAE